MFLLKKATLVNISKKPGAGFIDPALRLNRASCFSS
jgi:hypothetical protein